MTVKSVGFLISCLLTGTAVLSRPVLEIPNDKFDFGTVATNSTVSHYFWFKSTGSDTVKIEKIKTGCTCALMPLERDWIAPGDSMKVGIFWSLKNQIGKTGRFPYILSNAGTDPIQVSLTATVVPEMDQEIPVSVKPFKLELAHTPTARVDSIEFVLTNRSERDYQCLLVSFPLEQCIVTVPEQLKAKSMSRGYIRLKPEFADTEFKSSLTIAYLGSQPGRVSIPVRFQNYGVGAKQ
jgi:Protein of unknown function (DUF1573)